jgi:proteasome accessory factor C
MPKLNTFKGEDRYNFLLALVAYLQNRGEVTVEEAATHFGLDAKYIRHAVSSINDARAEVAGFEQWFFFIDIDAFEEDGILSLIDNSVITDVPRLSTRQVSAIAAGLNYLASMPAFSASKELTELQSLLAAGSNRGINPHVEIRPGTAEAGAEKIRRAILNSKQISCEYMNQKGERSIRIIEPLRIDASTDGWYLRGYCPIHLEPRNFKLDRMRSIEILDAELSEEAKKIEISDDALYVAEASDTAVTLEVEPEGYRIISEYKAISEPTTVAAGKVRAEIKVGHLPNIGRLVAKYGGAVKVLEPELARRYVKEYALTALGEASKAEPGDED